MPLSGIDIFKKLPKTNCQECGVPTCMAFAMKLAAGQAELSACPYIADDVRAQLEEASAPPIRCITIGTGEGALKIGGETVMFRHEKTFINPPGLGVLVSDAMPTEEVAAKLQRLLSISYERVGMHLKADIAALKAASGNSASFAALVEHARTAGVTNMVLMSEDPAVMAEGLKAASGMKPLIYAATASNLQAMADLAREHGCPLAVRGSRLDEVTHLTEQLNDMKLNDLVIDSGARDLQQVFEDQIHIRRAALKTNIRALGFPSIVFPCEMTAEPMQETLIAATFIPKYAGIIIMSDLHGANLFPLAVQRMNIYTDPQRPMATAEGIYEINNPDENSPVLITSNFSLTYFVVSGEVESSRMPAWLLIKDTEGLSVLTAWAAGKFVADSIAAFIKKSGITDKVAHRTLVIPGLAATISGDLEEELPGWTIQIGPREAAHLTPFLKNWKA